MIHPNMATTLAFVTTDLAIQQTALTHILQRATERTFNRASVDGDTSTNDSIYVLASGAASGRTVVTSKPIHGPRLRASWRISS